MPLGAPPQPAVPERETPGAAGRALLWLGPWSVYLVVTIVPLAFVIVLYGVIPVGDPESPSLSQQAVLLFVLTPALFTAVSWAYASIFYAGTGAERPFRASAFVEGAVWLTELAVLGPLVRFLATFNLYGLVAFGLCLIVTFAAILISALFIGRLSLSRAARTYLADPRHPHAGPAPAAVPGPAPPAPAPAQPLPPAKAAEEAAVAAAAAAAVSDGREKQREARGAFLYYYSRFLLVVVVLFLEVLLLVGYIFAFRYASSGLQNALPPVLRLSVFVFRITLLPLTDPFTLDVAMLICAYWVSNMMDFFFVLAYPVVRSPATFAVIWATYTIANLANLLFFLDCWFPVRLWLKAHLIGLFRCRPVQVPAPDEDDGPGLEDERGHSNNRPGYLRRQTRFFVGRMLSQWVAALFYLAVGPVLRFGVNSQYFLLHEMTAEAYRHSMIFTASNLGFQVLTGIAGFLFIRYKAPVAFAQVYAELRLSFANFRYLGCITAITMSNALISVALIMRQFKIWYAWTAPGQPTLAN